ncbi:hypothetical protein GQ43DRAFT_69993 [Delitschia confertaspora ATCC 74209]|uniref:Uncharacterized protein n=1 Tax=Delitschia confertaspora ATCC 74209 TaxID=1513339 RepID=A0A9P4MPD2_9PLEO|nr:hypothetical protein GQ43DRAFT_69993 [Delitschia confertaspora ATCC 74209]
MFACVEPRHSPSLLYKMDLTRILPHVSNPVHCRSDPFNNPSLSLGQNEWLRPTCRSQMCSFSAPSGLAWISGTAITADDHATESWARCDNFNIMQYETLAQTNFSAHFSSCKLINFQAQYISLQLAAPASHFVLAHLPPNPASHGYGHSNVNTAHNYRTIYVLSHQDDINASWHTYCANTQIVTVGLMSVIVYIASFIVTQLYV